MDKICRTCLRCPEYLTPLFGDTKLAHKIRIISGVDISENDNLPSNVCTECVVNINLSYNFRRVIINSDLDLRERCAFLKEKPSDVAENTVKHEEGNVKNEDENVIMFEDDADNYNEIQQKYVNELISGSIEYCFEDTEEVNDTLKESKVLNGRTRKRKKNEQRLYECNLCDYQSTDYSNYSRHRRSHVDVENQKSKICNICGKFISASNMTKHISIHTDPPVQCEECGKICKNNESLRGHLIIHKGINRTCKICGETCKERATYIAHRKTHGELKEQVVPCPFCSREFPKRSLKKHIRSHTGERPYPCEFCKKGFSSSNALKTHRRQHTNERPYKCELCPMAFPQKVSLRTHLISKHKSDENPKVL